MHESHSVRRRSHPCLPIGRVAGVDEIKRIAEDDGYGAQPGALAGALDAPVFAIGNGDLGKPAPAPIGYGRWTLLSAMSPNGVVDAAARVTTFFSTTMRLPMASAPIPSRLSEALDVFFENEDCGVAFIDQGDLTRFDQWVMALGRDEITGDLVALQRERADGVRRVGGRSSEPHGTGRAPAGRVADLPVVGR